MRLRRERLLRQPRFFKRVHGKDRSLHKAHLGSDSSVFVVFLEKNYLTRGISGSFLVVFASPFPSSFDGARFRGQTESFLSFFLIPSDNDAIRKTCKEQLVLRVSTACTHSKVGTAENRLVSSSAIICILFAAFLT